jgi:hypothetical protein
MQYVNPIRPKHPRSRKELRLRRRRVRQVCGGIIAVSLLLAIFVHKGLLAIAAFVGAWQIFCGLRETCRELQAPATGPALEMFPPAERHEPDPHSRS